jgi:hypothetical protein
MNERFGLGFASFRHEYPDISTSEETMHSYFNSTQFFLSLGASAVGRQSIFSACLNRFCNTPNEIAVFAD